MKRRAYLEDDAIASIRSFGLSRQVLLDLLIHIADEMPARYESFQRFRNEDQRCAVCTISILEGNEQHLFALEVDDSTADDRLAVAQIVHRRRTV